ncbi:hypothetical protein SNEBB_003547 [Seison nebaliae]|nr:hypothetical protein SNEBB_003547 [Seison nebaliae]
METTKNPYNESVESTENDNVIILETDPEIEPSSDKVLENIDQLNRQETRLTIETNQNHQLVTYETLCAEKSVMPLSLVLRQASNDVFNMENYGISEVQLEAIFDSLQTNTMVAQLNLNGNNLSRKSMHDLYRLMLENVTIHHLNLSINNLQKNDSFNILFQIMSTNFNITELILSQTGMTDKQFEQLLKVTVSYSKLQYLDLSHNQISGENGEQIAQFLERNSGLESLNLSWNHLQNKVADHISHGIKKNSFLKNLSMARNGFENDGGELLSNSLKLNDSIISFDISGNRLSDESVLSFVQMAVRKDNDSALNHLDLSFNSIKPKSFYDILEMLKEKEICLMSINLMPYPSVGSSDGLGSNRNENVENLIDEIIVINPELLIYYGCRGPKDEKEIDPADRALNFIRNYCAAKDISLIDLFTQLDQDGSMSVTHNEFRQGIKQAGLPITPLQLEHLISYLDRDGDGEIDFSELIIGEVNL